MIEITNISKDKPYQIFKSYYKNALQANQRSIEAISISSFNKNSQEVESRYVNLKYIIDNEWSFFSNYESPKAYEFFSHDQISGLFFWREINVQIRLKSKIFKSTKAFSDQHFQSRSKEKNALAISSFQSQQIHSFGGVENSYQKALSQIEDQTDRPNYWGGFTFIPYYFEFWEGHKNRLNKRRVFKSKGENWEEYILQP